MKCQRCNYDDVDPRFAVPLRYETHYPDGLCEFCAKQLQKVDARLSRMFPPDEFSDFPDDKGED